MKSLKVQVLIGIVVLAAIAAAVLLTRKGASGPGDLKKDFSYTLGSQYAQNIKKQNVEVDQNEFLAGASDVLNNRKARLTDEEMQKVLRDWQTQFDAKLVDRAKENRAKGDEFLAKYKAQEGVKTTKLGAFYKELKAGSGTSPKEGDIVKVHYTGKLIDGTVFDTSANLPDAPEMPIKNLIPGWVEALTNMKPGSKWEIAIPPTLGYGDSVHPKIPPGSVLVFEIEMLAARAAEATAPAAKK